MPWLRLTDKWYEIPGHEWEAKTVSTMSRIILEFRDCFGGAIVKAKEPQVIAAQCGATTGWTLEDERVTELFTRVGARWFTTCVCVHQVTGISYQTDYTSAKRELFGGWKQPRLGEVKEPEVVDELLTVKRKFRH